MANNKEQLRERLSIILDAYKRYVRDDGPRPFAKLQTKLTKKLALDEVQALIEAEATRRAISELKLVRANHSVTISAWVDTRIAELKRQAEGEK